MRNILEYLERSEALYPDHAAVMEGSRICSYQELGSASRRAGSFLAKHLPYGVPVAVVMEKGICCLEAFFAAVYAGGFYTLLNPGLPIKRLEQVQSVLEAEFVITDEANRTLAETLFPRDHVFLIGDLVETPENPELLSEVRRRMIDTDPLYANFTSGSTGVPKGVVVCHRSVIDFIDVFAEIFGISHADIIGNQAPFDFDVSVKDIYSTMKSGGTMVIMPKELFSRPKELLDLICGRRITTLIWAVSALCLISTFHGLDYRVPKDVNKVLFSGEVMPEKHLRCWMEHLPEARFVNLYGPTEITCNCAYHVIDRSRKYEQGIPIGRPFPNEHIFLLDESEKEVTVPGTVGEICVRGTALALGYYRSPEQTEAVFTRNPLNTSYSERIYRTGDLGKYGENGELYFCGRKDFQIKHMGHRIELEEV